MEEAMKRLTTVIGMVSVLALLFAADSFAQDGPDFKWRGSGGWDTGTPSQRMYDPAKVETIKGIVEAVEMNSPKKGINVVALMLKADKESITVQLGPEWYISRLDIKIKKGDIVEVKGARVGFADKHAIIAAEVKKGNEILVLRNDAGIPVWAGGRR
jgi:hypothetical protein